MDRRDWLKGAASAALASGLPIAATGAARAVEPLGRVRPGDIAWPAESVWAELKAAVGGRLVTPMSMTAACEVDPKSAACAALYKDLGNPFYIGDQAGGTQVSGWLDAWRPAPSARAVAARSTADVVAAVNFARRHNLRLVVKGGGHSYQGTSNAPDSLLVWTRAMNDIVVHDDTVSIGAGAIWVDVYDAVTTQAGRYVQGGGCATVGVAGLIQSGGFGSFSKRYGLAAASLVGAEVVTADGVVREVSAAHEPELLWALKGGGGGSFGVVTRLTLQTHALAEAAGGFNGSIKAVSDEAFHRLVRAFVDLYAERLCNPHWGESVRIGRTNQLGLNMVFQGLSSAEAKAAWKPLFDFVAAHRKDYIVEGPRAGTQPMRQWWNFAALRGAHLPYMVYDPRPGAPAQHAWWSGDSEQVGAFLTGYDSLWLPAAGLAPGARQGLADALFAASRHATVELHFNKGLAGASAEAIAAARDTATNPAVLDAFALAIIASGGPPAYPGFPQPNLAAGRESAPRVAAATAVLRPLAPAGGSYVSESDYFNKDWRMAFWGGNYRRLRAVKDRYDPAGLFTVHHGVGSEDWSADGFTRLTA